MRLRTTWLSAALASAVIVAGLPLARLDAQELPPDPEVAADEADPDDPAEVGNPALEEAEAADDASVEEDDEPASGETGAGDAAAGDDDDVVIVGDEGTDDVASAVRR